MIESLARPQLDRDALVERYCTNRRHSAAIFALVPADGYLERPIPLRHPLAFYEGHLPAFSAITLLRKALGEPAIDEAFETLFRRGIDPASEAEAAAKGVPVWPAHAAIAAYGARVDALIVDALARAPIDDGARSPLLERAEAAYNILEHEEMHHETLLYILNRIAPERKHSNGRLSRSKERPPAATGRVTIPGGIAVLGAQRGALAFGWDNEFERSERAVGAFEIDVNPVTNAEYLAFVREGGPVPSFWIPRSDGFALLAQFETLDPMPGTWPVYATQEQAAAYTAWRGARLVTEAEYDRAAYGSPSDVERRYPWGDAEPTAAHGNFDFHRYDPQSVGSAPLGASAWGVADLLGNGWEWTSTPFAPLPGFAPMASYPEYSADFFDGVHYVMKGASPVTSVHHLRRSFRNWYRSDYPYAYAKFRCAYD
ncbi:MAG: SUMF1/EgtB/PvdO family nonheme iron enzyme [Candidatus Baltobacteraceae bacterium]